MRKYIVILIMVLMFAALLSGCATRPEGDWSKRDTWMQVAVTTAIMADAYTTSKIQYSPGGYERNPLGRKLLGRQPGTKETYIYLSSWAISNYLISRYVLPKKWRPYWQGATFAGHTIAVIGNCQVGLCNSRNLIGPKGTGISQ